MPGELSFLIVILLISGAVYYFIGRWASDELYNKGYPVWLGWVIALTGLIPTLLAVYALPSRREQRDRQTMMYAEAELARQNAGLPPVPGAPVPGQWGGAGYPPQQAQPYPQQPQQLPAARPFGLGAEPGHVPAGSSPVAQTPPGGVVGNQPATEVPIPAAAPRWEPPKVAGATGAAAPEPPGVARCGGCGYLIAPARDTCANCGLPKGG